VCIALCTIDAHNIAQNRPDNFPSNPPDNHHCSNDVYLREGGTVDRNRPIMMLEMLHYCSLICLTSKALSTNKLYYRTVPPGPNMMPPKLTQKILVTESSRDAPIIGR